MCKTSRSLVSKLVVKYSGTTLQNTLDHDIFKNWEDLFRSQEEWDHILLEGIQSEDLNKKTSGVTAPASQVVRGSDPTKLEYKLTNIQLG